MTACGRNQMIELPDYALVEWLLLRKADIQIKHNSSIFASLSGGYQRKTNLVNQTHAIRPKSAEPATG